MKFYLSLVLCLFMAAACQAQSTDFTKIESRITELIEKSQWDELLITAPELITEDPSKPHGYYYSALAFSKLNDPSKADEYLSVAEPLAEDNMKEKISALKEAIKNGYRAEELSKSAEAAASPEIRADALKKLWENDKTKIDYALDAVELYVEGKKYEPALEILTDPTLSNNAQVKTLINRLNQKPEMVKINSYRRAMSQGDASFQKKSYDEALRHYGLALKILPGNRAALSKISDARQEGAWAVATKENTINSYTKYINTYPRGIYKERADETLQRGYLFLARKYAKENNFADAEKNYLGYKTNYPDGKDMVAVNTELCQLYSKEAKKQEKTNTLAGVRSAIQLYQQASACISTKPTLGHMQMLARKEKRWNHNNIGFLGWHADEKNLIGIMFGGLNIRKLGFYMAGRMNPDMFKEPGSWETDNNNSTEQAYHKDLTFTNKTYHQSITGTMGLTKKIVYPLWIYAGAGVAAHTELREFANPEGKKYLAKNKDYNFVAINPEAGLQVALPYVTLRAGVNKPITPVVKDELVTHFGVAFKL